MSRISQTGFTLIELVLAMSIFITVLVISTAGFIGINQTYGKGLLRKQLSEATQRTVEDITKTMRENDDLDDDRQPSDGTKKALCNSMTCYVWGAADDGSGLVRTKGNNPNYLTDKYELVDGRFKVQFIQVEPVGNEGDLYNIRGLIRTKNVEAFDSLDDPAKTKCKGTTETDASRGCALERFSIIVNVKAGSL